MKKSLTGQLIFMVASLLCVYAATAALVFSVLSQRQLESQTALTLRRSAYNIAKSLSESLNPSEEAEDLIALIEQNPAMEYQMLLMERLTQSDLWIVSKNHRIATHQNDNLVMIENQPLPPESEAVLGHALTGKTFEKTSSATQKGSRKYITVGTPVTGAQGKIVGAVLLYAPIRDTEGLFNSQNALILVGSLMIALLFCSFLGVYLSFIFNHPILELKRIAARLAAGDYQAQTHLNRQDELGQLAKIMDALAHRLNEAQTRQKQAEQNRRAFLSNISHELKTPVTVICGSLELVCDDIVTDPDEIHRVHLQMLTEATQLKRLISDLLELTKLQNHEFVMAVEPVSLTELLGDVLLSAKTLATAKNISVICMQPQNDWQISGDYLRLRQLLMILVDNAIKYTAKNKRIFLSLSQTEPALIVRDEGDGISQAVLPHIFDRYYRVNNAQSFDGTGLGLSIALEIANAHNAKIDVASVENEGSTFSIIFPEQGAVKQ